MWLCGESGDSNPVSPALVADAFQVDHRHGPKGFFFWGGGGGEWGGCLTSQQRARVSQGRICSDNITCCHTEIEVADQTFYLTQSQYIDTGSTSPSADPITPGAWQGSHWNANFEVTGMTPPGKKYCRKRESNPGSSALEADVLTTRPTRRWCKGNIHGEMVEYNMFPGP